MKRKIVLSFLPFLFFTFGLVAQNEFKSEDELKEKAEELFEQEDFVEATPLYAQLLSLYPQDANYNYKYGACLLASDGDKTKPMTYLEFAVTKSGVDPLAYYYLAKGNHLNYNFGKAVKYYSRFKTKASSDQRERYQLDHQIEMCKNGNQLLSKLNEVQVLDRHVVSEKDFFRVYELEGINGKLLAKPEDFKSKYDIKLGEKSVIYLPNDAKEVYYSSYGKKGDNGLDIYKSIKLGNDTWSEGVSIGESINTAYDENFPFIHPDGKTLYFASNGHNSMGGYDLFKSTLDISTGLWSSPVNLDFAFCSTDDDLLFVTDVDQVTAYFASNRSNEKGKFTVYKVLVERKPIELSVIQGKFIAENNPELNKAKITVIDKGTNKTIGVYETNNKGEYSLEILNNGGTYQFNIETTADAPIHTGVVNIPKQEEFEILGQELRLVGEGNEQQLVIKNIFDGTTAQNSNSSGPQVSANVLRAKANLDVNFSANQLASLENNTDDYDESEPANSNAVDVNAEADISPVADNTAAVTVPSTTNEANLNSKPASLNAEGITLKENYSTAKAAQRETVKQRQVEVDNAFSEAIEIEKEASLKFEELAELKSNNAPVEEVQKLEKEAKEIALKAAFATEVAQLLNQELNREKNTLSQFNQKENSFNSNLENDELAAAELQLKELTKSHPNSDELLSNLEKNANEELSATNTSIESAKSKQQNFDEEIEKVKTQVAKSEKELASAKEKDRQEVKDKLDGLKLDLKDLEFQSAANEEELAELQNEQKTLTIKEEQLIQAKTNLSNSSDQGIVLPDSDKTNLASKIQSYKNKDQIAYVNQAKSQDNQNVDISSNSEVIEKLNKVHGSELTESNKIEDTNLRNARKVQVYDNWINELELAMIAKEVEIGETSNQADREDLQNEIAAIQREIDQKINLRDKTEEVTASSVTSIDQVDSDLTETFDFEEEEVEAQIPESLSEVDDLSVIPEDFTNFNYDQSYKFGNQRPSLTMGIAKKALFEAREISIQAEKARNEGYSLPTPEERSAAFERANKLEQESEQKQLEAADYFAEYNKNEYEINRRRIFNANQFEDEFESDALDLANLLAEEGQVYFNDAAAIRREINPADRLSQKEVSLQKAYDYEMLALKKQRQAMTKISLVDDQYLKQESQLANQNNPAFVQTITDIEVLNVKNPAVAQQKADSLYASVENLNKAAELKLAESEAMPVGNERDEAIVEYENLTTEIEQNKTQAAIYYERKKQLENGLTSGKVRFSEPSDGVTAPMFKNFITEVTIDTIDISEERKDIVMNSKAFESYTINRQNRNKVAKQASSEYAKAVSLSSEKQQLEKQATLLRNQVELEKDVEEKQRLVKSAEVIDQRIVKNQVKIDSLNTLIKVKNYLISTSDQKMNASISNLSEMEQREIVQLANSASIEAVSTEQIASNTTIPTLVEGGVESSAQETSNEFESSETLDSESTASTAIPVTDVAVLDNSTIEVEVIKPSSNETEATVDEPEIEEKKPEVIVEMKPEIIEKEPEVVTKKPEAIKNVPSLSLANVNEVPRQLKQAIFVNLRPDESAYSKNKPIPVSTEMPEGLIYKVQVGAFRNPIPQNLFRGFAPLYAEKIPSGITRYTAGLFKDEGTATQARNEIRKLGYPDAFVVVFLNGKRISNAEARGDKPSGSSATKPGNTGVINQNNFAESNTSNAPLSAQFEEADVASVVDAKTIEKVYYTVQIGVFSKAVKEGVFNYEKLNVVELPNGLIRYNAGIFESAIEAADLKNNIQTQIPDAFVTAYKKGSRISLNEASKMKNSGQ